MKKVIEINDVDPMVLSGPNDENLKLIEEKFKSLVVLRGNKVNLDGNKREVDIISRVFQEMELIALKKSHISKNDISTLINFIELKTSFSLSLLLELIVIISLINFLSLIFLLPLNFILFMYGNSLTDICKSILLP